MSAQYKVSHQRCMYTKSSLSSPSGQSDWECQWKLLSYYAHPKVDISCSWWAHRWRWNTMLLHVSMPKSFLPWVWYILYTSQICCKLVGISVPISECTNTWPYYVLLCVYHNHCLSYYWIISSRNTHIKGGQIQIFQGQI